MAGPFEQGQLVPRREAGQMAHVTRFHHPITAAADPEAGHGQLAGEQRQLAHRAAIGAAGQQALGGACFGPQRRADRLRTRQLRQPAGAPLHEGGTSAPEQGERPGLKDASTGGDLHQALQLAAEVVGAMESNAAAERMADQHHRPAGGLLLHRRRQPAAVAGQAALQSPGPGPLTETGQIRAPKLKPRRQFGRQRRPEPPGQQPAMHGHKQQLARIRATVRRAAARGTFHLNTASLGGTAQEIGAAGSRTVREWAGGDADHQAGATRGWERYGGTKTGRRRQRDEDRETKTVGLSVRHGRTSGPEPWQVATVS